VKSGEVGWAAAGSISAACYGRFMQQSHPTPKLHFGNIDALKHFFHTPAPMSSYSQHHTAS
uniref:hypothetical protein n=1 Tax=uncultured Acidovorax sp. TaxID=158751 RepID=UPI0025E39F3C